MPDATRGGRVAGSGSAPAARGATSIFLGLVSSYWAGASRVTAWVLSTFLLCLVLASVTLQARINAWNARFFDALEKRSQPDIPPLLWQFAGYVLIAGLIMVVTVLVRMYLMVQLRRWVTTHVYTHWLDSHAYLRLERTTKGAETPEFRIADDVRLALDQLADLAVGFFTSLLLAITFFAVLAQVGGSLTIGSVTIPAYFLVMAVVYAVCLSGLTSLLGYPLIARIQRKNHLEGEFRYELMKVREEAPAISTKREENARAGRLSHALDELVHQWQRVLVWQSQVMGIASANAVLVGVFPVILAIPKYMTGEMSLGSVMQLATAFVQVQLALNWIVDNFVRVAEMRASANRVGELVAAMDEMAGAVGAAMPPPDDKSSPGILDVAAGNKPTV